MATGSGKTLIMHLNYHQFMHYGAMNLRTSLDNILLITPKEGLSKQHLNDLQKSGIPAKRFDMADGGLTHHERDTVQVIEITKLTRKSRRRGITLDSFILSATAYDDLKPRYDDGKWTKEKFAKHHILFFSDQESLGHIAQILKLPTPRTG